MPPSNLISSYIFTCPARLFYSANFLASGLFCISQEIIIQTFLYRILHLAYYKHFFKLIENKLNNRHNFFHDAVQDAAI